MADKADRAERSALETMELELQALRLKASEPGLSQAMKFKMKREVAMKNAACIKERRRVAEAK